MYFSFEDPSWTVARFSAVAIFLAARRLYVLRVVTFAVSISVCDAELKLEATAGENVTISFKTAELEGADQVRISFTRDRKTLIARYVCDRPGDCRVLERAGVSLRIEEGVFTLLNVSSESSGLYEAQVFNGKDVPKKTVTLVVKPRISSSRSPPQTSTSQPPQTSISERRRIYALIALVLFLGVLGVLGVCFFCKNMRTPNLQKTECERNCSDRVAVSFKT